MKTTASPLPHCDLCAQRFVRAPAPYYRQVGRWMKNLCAFHELARRRIVLFRQREARSVSDAWLVKDEQGHASVHGVN
jgi:hypothetical protein